MKNKDCEAERQAMAKENLKLAYELIEHLKKEGLDHPAEWWQRLEDGVKNAAEWEAEADGALLSTFEIGNKSVTLELRNSLQLETVRQELTNAGKKESVVILLTEAALYNPLAAVMLLSIYPEVTIEECCKEFSIPYPPIIDGHIVFVDTQKDNMDV